MSLDKEEVVYSQVAVREFKPIRIEIKAKPPHLALRIVLFSLIVLSAFFLINFLVGLFLGNTSLRLLPVLAMSVFVLALIYLVRLFLWNTYGKEIIFEENQSIVYLADYKWFKDGRQEVKKTTAIWKV